MKNSWLSVAAIAISGAALFGCSGSDREDDDTSSGPGVGPTFHKDVEPILQVSCQGCHGPGGIAPFELLDYEDARGLSSMIAIETEAKTMPPWGAQETEECQPRHAWKNDIRLTEEQIALLKAWDEAGAPEGDPADAPPAYEPPPNGLPGVEQVVEPLNPYVTSGDSDEFRCFVLDPKLTSVAYLNGVHVLPGNAKVVHHAVLVADPTGASAAMAEADGSFDCFGGVGMIPGGQLLHVWTPGGVPFELPSNVAMPLAPGSLMVMQIHYHPAGTTADPDTTKVELRYSDSKPEYYVAASTPIGNFTTSLEGGNGLLPGPSDGAAGPEFKVPAGAADHLETMRFTVPQTTAEGDPLPKIWVYGAAAHMHYVGTNLKVEVEHAAADPLGDECLLHEPAWDFDWQRTYLYDADIESLPTLSPGDVVKLTCRYNNTVDNPGVARALADAQLSAPKDVFLGEQTLDEMCLTLLPLLVKAP